MWPACLLKDISPGFYILCEKSNNRSYGADQKPEIVRRNVILLLNYGGNDIAHECAIMSLGNGIRISSECKAD